MFQILNKIYPTWDLYCYHLSCVYDKNTTYTALLVYEAIPLFTETLAGYQYYIGLQNNHNRNRGSQ